jgi:hypothetical protein
MHQLSEQGILIGGEAGYDGQAGNFGHSHILGEVTGTVESSVRDPLQGSDGQGAVGGK